ncbi:MAG: amidohydrolase family protein, partial [Firmicutes bacterium]|nr:amidohydrolase family protein [Candidatus Caballimonas caccae]
MEIFDSHAHIYPEKIAEKATTAIGDFYNIKMEENKGTPSRLIEVGNKAGISRFLVHSCATKSSQVHSINEFILEEMKLHPEFIGFMTLHQDLTLEEMKKEIEFCVKNGFKGIKLHPDFQKFDIDGEDADKIYRAIIETKCNFPILFHMGDNRYEYSKPEKLCIVAKKYPTINFIGAHFGGYRCWDRVEQYKGLENVYFDTSSSLAFISSERAKELIRFFTADRF